MRWFFPLPSCFSSHTCIQKKSFSDLTASELKGQKNLNDDTAKKIFRDPANATSYVRSSSLSLSFVLSHPPPQLQERVTDDDYFNRGLTIPYQLTSGKAKKPSGQLISTCATRIATLLGQIQAGVLAPTSEALMAELSAIYDVRSLVSLRSTFTLPVPPYTFAHSYQKKNESSRFFSRAAFEAQLAPWLSTVALSLHETMRILAHQKWLSSPRPLRLPCRADPKE